MGLRVIPYEKEHEPAVAELNARLASAGSEHAFATEHQPSTLARGRHPSLFQEYFVAVDDEQAVRGAYVLKRQDFLVNGEILNIANYTYPLSEGIVDRKHSAVGLAMLLDAQKRLPYLYDLGLGSFEHPSAQLQKAVGWQQRMVDFHFRAQRPSRVLRNLTSLRRTTGRRLLLDALAVSGAGWAASKAHQLAKTRKTREGLSAEMVDEFGPWADNLWQEAGSQYGFCAVRDRSVLNALYPPGDPRYIRLSVSKSDRVIGWALLLDTQMKDHNHFGDLRVGTIADGFATPEVTEDVIGVAASFLADRGVDLIISNQSHLAWREALESSGFHSGPSNFVLSLSKPLAARAEPDAGAGDRTHINRGDGDGPINL